MSEAAGSPRVKSLKPDLHARGKIVPRYLKNAVYNGAATPSTIRQTGSDSNDPREWPVMNQAKDIVKLNLSGVSFCKADECWGRLVAGGGVESNINIWVLLHFNVATYCICNMTEFGCLMDVPNPE